MTARTLAATAIIAMTAGSASAAFNSYIIRNGNSGSPQILANNVYVPGATEFVISEGGMKAGYGSDDINGGTIGDITSLQVTRYDDTGRFPGGSGPAVAPYFNIWVTDGLGNYAVLANEPSNADFQPLFTTNLDGSKSYDLSFADLADKPVQVYETPGGGYNATTTWVNNLFGTNLTFGDVASLEIAPPPPSYIAGGNGVGSGAPRELGSNTAYGFNWIFGDTLSNYVSGMEGYVVSGAVATPAPSTLALLGIGGLAASRRRRA